MLYHCWLEQHQEAEQTATAVVNCYTNFLMSFNSFSFFLCCSRASAAIQNLLKSSNSSPCANINSTENRGWDADCLKPGRCTGKMVAEKWLLLVRNIHSRTCQEKFSFICSYTIALWLTAKFAVADFEITDQGSNVTFGPIIRERVWNDLHWRTALGYFEMKAERTATRKML